MPHSNDKLDDDGDLQQQQQSGSGHDRPGSHMADLEKVTDYVEEKEIQTDKDLQEVAMNFIDAQRTKDQTERAAREQEFAEVTIHTRDIDLLVKEMDIGQKQAVLALRHNKGDVVQALIELTN